VSLWERLALLLVAGGLGVLLSKLVTVGSWISWVALGCGLLSCGLAVHDRVRRSRSEGRPVISKSPDDHR
jgi:hypothetical protein